MYTIFFIVKVWNEDLEEIAKLFANDLINVNGRKKIKFIPTKEKVAGKIRQT